MLIFPTYHGVDGRGDALITFRPDVNLNGDYTKIRFKVFSINEFASTKSCLLTQTITF